MSRKAALRILQFRVTRATAVATLRCLARAGHRVIGADDRRLPFDLHSRHCGPYWLHPPPESPDFLEAIAKLVVETRPDVVVPAYGTQCLVKFREELMPQVAIPVAPYDRYEMARDKRATALACLELGIPTPVLLTQAEALERLERHGETIVVKPRFDVGGAADVHYVRDPQALIPTVDSVTARHGAALIQEFIPGPADHMRTVNVLFDQENRMVARFTLRKLWQWPLTGGTTALAVSTHDWDLVEMVEPLFQKWQWSGPAEVELKVDPRDGLPKVIEVNPRFWSYAAFPAHCGVNIPAMACELAVGRRLPAAPPSYAAGVKYVNRSALLRAVKDARVQPGQRRAAVRRLYRDLQGPRFGLWNDLADPVQLIGKALLPWFGADRPAAGKPFASIGER